MEDRRNPQLPKRERACRSPRPIRPSIQRLSLQNRAAVTAACTPTDTTEAAQTQKRNVLRCPHRHPLGSCQRRRCTPPTAWRRVSPIRMLSQLPCVVPRQGGRASAWTLSSLGLTTHEPRNLRQGKPCVGFPPCQSITLDCSFCHLRYESPLSDAGGIPEHRD
jgi:hypothetical protein